MTETRTCPMCAEQIPTDSAVCRYCGHSLANDDASTIESPAAESNSPSVLPQPKTCPICAEEIPQEAAFCRYCGATLAPPEAPHMVGPPTSEDPERESISGRRPNVCPACAEEVGPDDPFCKFCGQDLRSGLGAGRVDAAQTTAFRRGEAMRRAINRFAPLTSRIVDPLARKSLAPWLILASGLLLIAGAVLPWVASISITAPLLGIINHHTAAIVVGFGVISIACLRLARPSMPRLIYLLVLAAGVMSIWIAINGFIFTAETNRMAGEAGGEGIGAGVGIYLLLIAGLIGIWASSIAFRERVLTSMGAIGDMGSDWRHWGLAVIVVGVAIFLTATAVSNSAESKRLIDTILEDSESSDPAPEPVVNAEYQQCLNDVTYAVDQVAAGSATLQNVAYEYGIQDPRYQITMQAYSRYAGLAFQVGLEEAAAAVYNNVVEPGCAAEYGGP